MRPPGVGGIHNVDHILACDGVGPGLARGLLARLVVVEAEGDGAVLALLVDIREHHAVRVRAERR